MQKWEYFRLDMVLEEEKWWIYYKGQKLDSDQINALLKELGDQGWELVTSSSFDKTDIKGHLVGGYLQTYTGMYIYTFKRPKQ